MEDFKLNADYLPNKILLQEVIKSKQQGKATEKLGRYLILLVKRVKYTYFSYSDEYISQDVESEALVVCLEALDKFDETRSKNAFAFFTTTIRNAIKAGFKLNAYMMKNTDVEIIRYSDYDRVGQDYFN